MDIQKIHQSTLPLESSLNFQLKRTKEEHKRKKRK